MQARIDSPALTVPGALKALQAISNAVKQSDITETTLYLVELRASQINGCGVCVDIHTRELKHAGEPDERINAVAAWRDTSYFTERRACSARVDRSRDPDRRPAGPRSGRRVGQRRAPLRRRAARRARARDRRDQHLESPQRRHEADQRSLGRRMGCPKPERKRGSLTRAVRQLQLSGMASGADVRRSLRVYVPN